MKSELSRYCSVDVVSEFEGLPSDLYLGEDFNPFGFNSSPLAAYY